MKVKYNIPCVFDLDISKLCDILILNNTFTRSANDILVFFENNYFKIIERMFDQRHYPEYIYESQSWPEILSAIETELKSRGYDD